MSFFVGDGEVINVQMDESTIKLIDDDDDEEAEEQTIGFSTSAFLMALLTHAMRFFVWLVLLSLSFHYSAPQCESGRGFGRWAVVLMIYHALVSLGMSMLTGLVVGVRCCGKANSTREPKQRLKELLAKYSLDTEMYQKISQLETIVNSDLPNVFELENYRRRLNERDKQKLKTIKKLYSRSVIIRHRVIGAMGGLSLITLTSFVYAGIESATAKDYDDPQCFPGFVIGWIAVLFCLTEVLMVTVPRTLVWIKQSLVKNPSIHPARAR